ncbi:MULTISPECIES: GNAT family N-acetyltransferase [unclassified Ruminococcus]|uniref:GNAT family N-acetyltransferase n=1 Tax=unclassified Ruminococcus TaxID=2608920 RepID=UPI00210CBA58|nr:MULTISPECIES: GNAT family N-acetyltransferase [unclassified Ruminococcus]MCQ4021764.1 GNAT family N-acetyltransferase [Ruminococcus sp. zg-924]MCQ4114208.1 GNAT family N-acetyltransferase [Ruminococcus sp. zg-921]
MITYLNSLTVEEYLNLRDVVGWCKLSFEQSKRGLEHSNYITVARDNEKAIGMARVLFDFGYTAYITDVIVHPDYQGKGIGTQLVNNILDFLKENSDENEFMSYVLIANKGKEDFYKKFGFVTRPTDSLGAGMTLRLNG